MWARMGGCVWLHLCVWVPLELGAVVTTAGTKNKYIKTQSARRKRTRPVIK